MTVTQCTAHTQLKSVYGVSRVMYIVHQGQKDLEEHTRIITTDVLTKEGSFDDTVNLFGLSIHCSRSACCVDRVVLPWTIFSKGGREPNTWR